MDFTTKLTRPTQRWSKGETTLFSNCTCVVLIFLLFDEDEIINSNLVRNAALGAIQIIRDTFITPPAPAPCEILHSKITFLMTFQALETNCLLKPSLALKHDFFTSKSIKTIVKKKFMWHFVELPLECHILSEWPLIRSTECF